MTTGSDLIAVIEAAKAWSVERFPKDAYERHLMAMVAKAFPDEWHFSDDCVHCSEEDREGCSECPSRAELQAAIARSEVEMAAIKEAETKYREELEAEHAQLHRQE